MKKLCRLAASVLLLGAASAANSTVVTFQLGNANAFSGVAPGDTTGLYALATFDDHDTTGTVTLTMKVLNSLVANAYVNEWYFNIKPFPAAMSVTNTGGVAASPVSFSSNNYKADGTGGMFDLKFDFLESAHQLGRGAFSQYTISALNLTANSFKDVSLGGGMYMAAVKVQGYSVNGKGESVWLGVKDSTVPSNEVPEPATLVLLGFGLAGMIAVRRRYESGIGI